MSDSKENSKEKPKKRKSEDKKTTEKVKRTRKNAHAAVENVVPLEQVRQTARMGHGFPLFDDGSKCIVPICLPSTAKVTNNEKEWTTLRQAKERKIKVYGLVENSHQLIKPPLKIVGAPQPSRLMLDGCFLSSEQFKEKLDAKEPTPILNGCRASCSSHPSQQPDASNEDTAILTKKTANMSLMSAEWFFPMMDARGTTFALSISTFAELMQYGYIDVSLNLPKEKDDWMVASIEDRNVVVPSYYLPVKHVNYHKNCPATCQTNHSPSIVEHLTGIRPTGSAS